MAILERFLLKNCQKPLGVNSQKANNFFTLEKNAKNNNLLENDKILKSDYEVVKINDVDKYKMKLLIHKWHRGRFLANE